MELLIKIERLLGFISLIIPIPALILSIMQYHLSKKESKETHRLQQINQQYVAGNQINVYMNNNEQELYYKIQNRIQEIQQQKESLEEKCSIIETCFIKIITFTMIYIVINNLFQYWDSTNNLFSNLSKIVFSLYEAFNTAGGIVVIILFSLSIILLIKTFLFRNQIPFFKISLSIFTFITINIGNFMNWKLLNSYSLGKEMLHLIEQNHQSDEKLSFSHIIDIFSPFLVIVIIIASIYLAQYLLKIILTDVVFTLKIRLYYVLATLLYVGISIYFLFS